MENKFVLAIIVLVFAVLFASGFFIGDQQIDIAGCTAKWKTTPVTVQQSELCSQGQCIAQPSQQQHNAIVEAVLCACDKAKSGTYADDAVNKRIEEVLELSLNYRATAQEVCDSPGLILVRQAYG